MFCLWTLLGVLWCHVLYLGLWAILSLFLCMVWGSVLTSLIDVQLSSFPNTTCWRNCLFSIVYSCILLQRLTDHRCMSLFLGSLLGCTGDSLVIQLLWLCSFTAEGPGSIPGLETKIPQLPGAAKQTVLGCIDLHICFYANTMMFWLLWFYNIAWKVMPPDVFFFLSIALAILGFLWFYINFRIICSSSVKNVLGNLIEIALNL